MSELQFATSFVPTHNHPSNTTCGCPLSLFSPQAETEKKDLAAPCRKGLRYCGIFGAQRNKTSGPQISPQIGSMLSLLSENRYKSSNGPTYRKKVQRLIHLLIWPLQIPYKNAIQPKLIQHPRRQSSATLPETRNPLFQ
jgi:hypothetical protein